MTEVLVAGKRIRLDPSRSIGKGGEADVFSVGNGVAVKIFKDARHPDLAGQPAAQRAATERIALHQKKLPELLRKQAMVPARVVFPTHVATETTGRKVVGYSMPLIAGAEVLLRYGQRAFRQNGIGNDIVVHIFRNLHPTVSAVHGAGFVIGDFNDLNVLVRNTEAHLIDVDSYQFGSYLCQMFTQKFVDPTLCDPRAQALLLARPYNADADWYAFAVMLMQCLLFVDPYGGIFEPKEKSRRVLHHVRPLRRITVFHADVRYPKPATHYRVLPDDLLQCFHRIFEKDERGEFPRSLLETLRWTTCTQCGTEHARMLCPVCSQTTPAMVREVTTVRGQVKATRVFRTSGTILHASVENGTLQWLYHERDVFKREDGRTVLRLDAMHAARLRRHHHEDACLGTAHCRCDGHCRRQHGLSAGVPRDGHCRRVDPDAEEHAE